MVDKVLNLSESDLWEYLEQFHEVLPQYDPATQVTRGDYQRHFNCSYEKAMEHLEKRVQAGEMRQVMVKVGKKDTIAYELVKEAKEDG